MACRICLNLMRYVIKSLRPLIKNLGLETIVYKLIGDLRQVFLETFGMHLSVCMQWGQAIGSVCLSLFVCLVSVCPCRVNDC